MAVLLAVALLEVAVVRPVFSGSETASRKPVPAQFRGCDASGWCRFQIESGDPARQPIVRVYPDGAPRSDDATTSMAIRDRLNVLLASMIHQHKRILLHDLREGASGVFAATVTVNEMNLAADPLLQSLQKQTAHDAESP